MQQAIILIFKILSVTTLTFLVACGGSSGSDGGVNSPPTNIQEILDNSIDQGLDGIFVYIDNGTSQLSFAAGIQNRATAQAASPDALFKIASISKMFIATASTMLIHDGHTSS